MRLRSLLFVPADRPERFEKALASGADALILDLEDSVSPENKARGRAAVADWLQDEHACPAFVRINPLDGDFIRADLDAVAPRAPAGLVLPKAEGARSIVMLQDLLGSVRLLVLPIATETPAAIFELGSYRSVTDSLAGITWGAEDLPAAVGAATSREPDGSFTPPYEMARSLVLFAAHAARVPAIETVFPRIDATDALSAYVGRARRDGFSGMMAIHPSQVNVINRGFTPTAEDVAWAEAVEQAFRSAPGAGALRLDGQMIDAPHRKQARRILDLARDRA